MNCFEILGFVPIWYQHNHQNPLNPAGPILINKANQATIDLNY